MFFYEAVIRTFSLGSIILYIHSQQHEDYIYFMLILNRK